MNNQILSLCNFLDSAGFSLTLLSLITVMAPRGQQGGRARFLQQILYWQALNNAGLQTMINEGYVLGKF